MFDLNRFRAAAAHDPFSRRAVLLPQRIALTLDAALVLALAAVTVATSFTADVVGFFAIGAGLGIVTCIPIGIANVIVIDAAYRHGARRAIGASIGGAVADGLYASLGIFGVGPLISAYPTVPYVLHAISGCVLVGYGVVLLRSRAAFGAPAEPHMRLAGDGALRGGFVVGLAATLLNPSAVMTWVVIVGGHATGIDQVQAGAWVAGIVIGTFAWFLVVAFLALRGRNVLRGKAEWVTRIVGLVVIASGLFSFSRVLALTLGG
jgi:arginine exporter protein ArgO